MAEVINIANYFIIKSYQDGGIYAVTNMKVQKLLYYTQSLHLAMYNEPLFYDEIQAWQYGPVCPPVYGIYKMYGANILPKPSNPLLNFLPHIEELLEQIWLYFGKYHAYLLSDMTHDELPWKKARRGLLSDERSSKPVLLEDMKLLGKDKLDKIERDRPEYTDVMSAILQDVLKESDTPALTADEFREWLVCL
jgi:uncharacterized phage-associated protein